VGDADWAEWRCSVRRDDFPRRQLSERGIAGSWQIGNSSALFDRGSGPNEKLVHDGDVIEYDHEYEDGEEEDERRRRLMMNMQEAASSSGRYPQCTAVQHCHHGLRLNDLWPV
jgi:hypothetical protein